MITVNNLSYASPTGPLMHGVHFTLRQGDYLSVIGPNGTGKTTLLRCLLRLHAAGGGQGAIRVKDRPLHEYDQPALARVLSYVPQQGGVIPPLSVRELLQLSRYPHRQDKNAAADARAIAAALKITDMGPLAERTLPSLSGGERQKAYIAAALAQQAQVLLLDEPTAFLDPRHTAELLQLLHRLHDDGVTCLTVTHDMNHPLFMGGNLLALASGRQVYFGPVDTASYEGILREVFAHEFTYTHHPVTHTPVVLA